MSWQTIVGWAHNHQQEREVTDVMGRMLTAEEASSLGLWIWTMKIALWCCGVLLDGKQCIICTR